MIQIILIAVSIVVSNLIQPELVRADASGKPQAYLCGKDSSNRPVTLTQQVIDGTAGHYLDSMGRGNWKLEVPGHNVETLVVKILKYNIDKPISPMGAPRFECLKGAYKIQIFSNVAQDRCSDCSGPGAVTQYAIISSAGENPVQQE